MRVQQLAALARERQAPLVVAENDRLDEPLVAQMAERVAVDVEVVFRHHPKGAESARWSWFVTTSTSWAL